MYVLFALTDGEKHGYAIMQETPALSDCKFCMGPTTLYTTLQRLLDLGLIEEVGGSRSAEDSRRRYYRLMGNGKSLLETELARIDLRHKFGGRGDSISRVVCIGPSFFQSG